jgi:hypothetical protein
VYEGAYVAGSSLRIEEVQDAMVNVGSIKVEVAQASVAPAPAAAACPTTASAQVQNDPATSYAWDAELKAHDLAAGDTLVFAPQQPPTLDVARGFTAVLLARPDAAGQTGDLVTLKYAAGQTGGLLTLADAGGWYLAAAAESCDDKCASLQSAPNHAVMRSITNGPSVEDIATILGITCSEFNGRGPTLGRSYAGTPFINTNRICVYLTSSTDLNTNTGPPDGNSMCYCSKKTIARLGADAGALAVGCPGGAGTVEPADGATLHAQTALATADQGLGVYALVVSDDPAKAKVYAPGAGGNFLHAGAGVSGCGGFSTVGTNGVLAAGYSLTLGGGSSGFSGLLGEAFVAPRALSRAELGLAIHGLAEYTGDTGTDLRRFYTFDGDLNSYHDRADRRRAAAEAEAAAVVDPGAAVFTCDTPVDLTALCRSGELACAVSGNALYGCQADDASRSSGTCADGTGDAAHQVYNWDHLYDDDVVSNIHTQTVSSETSWYSLTLGEDVFVSSVVWTSKNTAADDREDYNQILSGTTWLPYGSTWDSAGMTYCGLDFGVVSAHASERPTRTRNCNILANTVYVVREVTTSQPVDDALVAAELKVMGCRIPPAAVVGGGVSPAPTGPAINLARACGVGENEACSSSVQNPIGASYTATIINDGVKGGTPPSGKVYYYHAATSGGETWTLDFGQRSEVTNVLVYLRDDDITSKIENFQLWIGDDSTAPDASDNVNCYTHDGTAIAAHDTITALDVPCVGRGRYFFFHLGVNAAQAWNEIEVMGHRIPPDPVAASATATLTPLFSLTRSVSAEIHAALNAILGSGERFPTKSELRTYFTEFQSDDPGIDFWVPVWTDASLTTPDFLHAGGTSTHGLGKSVIETGGWELLGPTWTATDYYTVPTSVSAYAVYAPAPARRLYALEVAAAQTLVAPVDSTFAWTGAWTVAAWLRAGAGDYTNGLVAWWKFDGNLQDSSGNGNHLESTSPVPSNHNFESGQLNNAIGTQRDTKISTQQNFQQVTQQSTFSISFWFKARVSTERNTFFLWGTETVGGGFGLEVNTASNKVLKYFVWGANDKLGTFALDSTDNFYHIVLVNTYDGSSNKQSVYINGLEEWSEHTSSNFDTGTSKFLLGYSDHASLSSNAIFDDFRIYNVALSQSEINNVYAFGRMRLNLHDGAGNPNVAAAVSAADLTPGAWTHVALTYDGSGTAAALHVNGGAGASTGIDPSAWTAGGSVRITGAGVDDLRVYTSDLSGSLERAGAPAAVTFQCSSTIIQNLARSCTVDVAAIAGELEASTAPRCSVYTDHEMSYNVALNNGEVYTHTASVYTWTNTQGSYARIDLEEDSCVTAVVFNLRIDTGTDDIAGFQIFVGNDIAVTLDADGGLEQNSLCYQHDGSSFGSVTGHATSVLASDNPRRTFTCTQAVHGRFVFITKGPHTTDGKYGNVEEIEVIGSRMAGAPAAAACPAGQAIGIRNLARECGATFDQPCAVTASSVLDSASYPSTWINDGDDGSTSANTFYTGLNDPAWISIDLGEDHVIHSVEIFMATHVTRFDSFKIFVGGANARTDGTVACHAETANGFNDYDTVSRSCNGYGRYVFLQQNSANHMTLHEMRVYGERCVPCDATDPDAASCAALLPAIPGDTGGWRLVRYLPSSSVVSTGYNPGDDLLGTDVGDESLFVNPPNPDEQWTKTFGTHTEILFVNGIYWTRTTSFDNTAGVMAVTEIQTVSHSSIASNSNKFWQATHSNSAHPYLAYEDDVGLWHSFYSEGDSMSGVSTRTNPTYIFVREAAPAGGGEPAAQTLARTTRGDSSWRLVRYMPPAASASAWNWHNIDDDLAGTSTYGDSADATQAWSVQFGTFTHYMLGACDMSLWGEITKAQYDGTPTSSSYMSWAYSEVSCVQADGSAAGSTGANRKSANADDPLFSVGCTDDWPSFVVYAEDNYDGMDAAVWDKGACVWVK